MNEQDILNIVSSVVDKLNIKMTLSLAAKIAEKVEQKAREIGVNAVCAVADAGGNLVLLHAMDNSYLASRDIAINKAYTAVALKMTTKQLGSLAAPDGSLYGIQFTNQGRIVIFGGGNPLKIADNIIGGVGVSGGNEEQDTFLGEFAAKAFEEEIACQK